MGKMPNQLFYGDNLDILREHIPAKSVDLVYLDPPFNTKQDYNVLFRDEKGVQSEAQIRAFKDTWHWTLEVESNFRELTLRGDSLGDMLDALRPALGKGPMLAYLVMMAARLLELHRVLKPTGSLYLHCDPTASHYLKMLLDMVFGPENFRNEIIWRRTGAHGKARRYAPLHDVIFFYTKTDMYTWNYPRTPYMRGHVEEHFARDDDGYKTKYYGNVLTGPGTRSGESGMPWRGFDPTSKGRHWAIPQSLVEASGEDMSNLSQHQKLDRLYELGYIHIEAGAAWPVYERRITDRDGNATSDIWAFQPYTQETVFGTSNGIDEDVRWLHPKDQERLGYPTQKPLGLLRRIIQASSNPGDVVLDPFCGCGTAIDAAHELGRQWIGIDITHLAILLIRNRLRDRYGDIPYEVHGIPQDVGGARALAQQDRFQFEWWALSLVGARPARSQDDDERKVRRGTKGADKGIDGVITFKDATSEGNKRALVQVKSGSVSSATVRDLVGTVTRENAAIGILISLEPIKDTMYAEAATAGFYDAGIGRLFPKIQLYSVEELLTGAKRVDVPRDQTTFKRAKAADGNTVDQLDLF
jgi:site-specific DNA-methyltransferase (adenine-specific)